MITEKHDLLIAGQGGREAALGWKLRQSPWVNKIYFAAAKNNFGTGRYGENIDIDLSDPSDPAELERRIRAVIDFVAGRQISLTVVGYEHLLAAGMVNDYYENDLPTRGCRIFGPNLAAAKVEWSKADGMDFCRRHGIPHAHFRAFDRSQLDWAHRFLDATLYLVVKADGLSFGKGAYVCSSPDQAHQMVEELLVHEKHGRASRTIVIQEKLRGRELSVQAIVDGKSYLMLPHSVDYKRSSNDQEGLNTGGMGGYAPVDWVTPELGQKIEQKIVQPFVKGMATDGRPFMGIYYPGVMVVDNEPYVFEINTRFGDPEAQVVLPVVSTDLFPALYHASLQNLSWGTQGVFNFREVCSVGVVLASQGYPGEYSNNLPIYNPDKIPDRDDLQVFFAAVTKDRFGRLLTNGGRVMSIVAQGQTLPEARHKVYQEIGPHSMGFVDNHYFHDIALPEPDLD